MGDVVEKTQCPKCAEQGRDNSGDNLVVYADGGAKCYACGYIRSKGEGKITSKVSRKARMTPSQCETYPVGHDPHRMIDQKVIDLYGVRSSFDEESGEPNRTFYPYGKDDGSFEYKIRNNKDKRKMSCTGKLPGFFGRHLCQPTVTQRLFITEGEEDTLAAKNMLWPLKLDVVSLPNGATLDQVVKDELSLLEQYKEVFVCLDADTPGLAASIEVADWIAGVTNVKVVGLDPDIGKDASDYRKAGKDVEFRKCVKSAKPYEPDGVVNGLDIMLDDLLEPMPEGYPIPFAGLQNKLHGLRKGEIVTVCAGSGIGKSTLVREIAKSMIEQGLTVANVALEDQMNVAAQALLALDMNIPLPVFRVRPPSKSDVQTSYEKLVANGRTYFYKHFGGLSVDTLMPKLYHYARSKDCDFIFLDHLSMVISGSESRNERKDIDMLMHKLAQMVVETGVGLVQIVHLKRTGGDKSFAKGGEVELTDLRGSAALEQLSWAVVGMERDQQGDDRDFSNVRLLKNRTWGFTGLCDSLKYETDTGRLVNATPEPVDLEEDYDALDS